MSLQGGDIQVATDRDSTEGSPMFCTKCDKVVTEQGPCPAGGHHHLIALSDKNVRGQNKSAKVASGQDRIRAYALQYLAHDSGDGQTVYHCPFCGGGNVVGRSDGTIECGFCNTHFTVQVQPEFAGMPQTIDGQPYDVPGMPGGVDPNTGMPPQAGGGEEPPFGEDGEDGEEGPEEEEAEMGSPEDEEDQGKNGTSVPWQHQSSRRYLTPMGSLTEDQYLAHLALIHSAGE